MSFLKGPALLKEIACGCLVGAGVCWWERGRLIAERGSGFVDFFNGLPLASEILWCDWGLIVLIAGAVILFVMGWYSERRGK